MHALRSIFSIRKTFNARNVNCLFSVDLMPIGVKIYMFLNKTPTNKFRFASFPLVQFLLIVLSVEVTSINNGTQAWVAYSQGRASAGSHAHLVIEFGPSIQVNIREYILMNFTIK